MQRLPVDIFRIGIVQIVSDKGMADIFHVNTDLMGTARLQDEGDKAVPVFFSQDAVVCDCTFPFLKVDLPLDQGTSGPADGSVYRSV